VSSGDGEWERGKRMSGEWVGTPDYRFEAFFWREEGGTLNSTHFLAGREVEHRIRLIRRIFWREER
jgi:hypothetical protein